MPNIKICREPGLTRYVFGRRTSQSTIPIR